MSNKQQIKLVSLGVISYARINKDYKAQVDYPQGVDITEELKKIDNDNGIVLVFPDNYRFQQSEGNQGVGKSSLHKALLELTGNIMVPNAINSIDNDKRINLKTWGLDGHLYHIRATKSTYVIERIETDEEGNPIISEKGKEIKAEIKEPKTMIKKIVGPAGVSPNWLVEMKPADQIAWVRSLFTLDQDVLKQELDITKKYNEAYKARTQAGNDHKRYKNLTESSPFYKEQEKHEKYFAETSFENVEQSMKSIQERHSEYQRNEMGLKQLKDITLQNALMNVEKADETIVSIENEIKRLQQELAKAHDDKQATIEAKIAVENRIKAGEEWIEANKSVVQEMESFGEKVKEASEFKAKKQEWEVMLENQKQMNHYESEYQRLTVLIDEYAKTKQQLVEMFTPKVEGFEVCIPDENEKREGLFYKGMSLDKLSESELWEMATQLWQVMNVQMVFVENINSLGTGAVEKFNEFIAQGGYVFATMMNRAEKNLKITFDTSIK